MQSAAQQRCRPTHSSDSSMTWIGGLPHDGVEVPKLCGIFRFIVILAAILCSSRAQVIDSSGTDFIVAFLVNPNVGNIELHLTAATTSTAVTVEYPVGTTLPDSPVTVMPGQITIVALPVTASSGWVANTISSNGVRISATNEFIVYMVNRFVTTSDAALALPVDALNTEYIVMDYDGLSVSLAAEFVVIAAFDNTNVTITPAKAIVGHPATTPFTVMLDRGQAYFAKATGRQSLTGSIISATRPVSVTNGDRCTNIPIGVLYCDHIFEVAQPVQSWGKQIAVANLPQRQGGTIYRIVASENDTVVTQNGLTIDTILSRGQFYETPLLNENVIFASIKPIFVTQYMTGRTSPGAVSGDPAMGNMIPTDQYLNRYTFSTVGGSQFATHYVSIIANFADVDTLTLDGATLPTGSFSQIGSSTFYAAALPLAEGTHTTISKNAGHGITVEGYNQDDSYLYPGGARFQSINPIGDPYPPVCTELTRDQNLWMGNATDEHPSEDINGDSKLDENEDTNGNGILDKDTGIFSVVLLENSTNVKLTINFFIPGDPVVEFSVDRINEELTEGSGIVLVTDGAGNTCTLEVGFTCGTSCNPTSMPASGSPNIPDEESPITTAPTLKPSISIPGTPKPSVSIPGIPKPSVSIPTISQPSTPEPSTSKPSTSKPSVFIPSTSKPNTPKARTLKPSTSKARTLKPSISIPATFKPSTFKDSTSKPSTSKARIPKPKRPRRHKTRAPKPAMSGKGSVNVINEE